MSWQRLNWHCRWLSPGSRFVLPWREQSTSDYRVHDAVIHSSQVHEDAGDDWKEWRRGGKLIPSVEQGKGPPLDKEGHHKDRHYIRRPSISTGIGVDRSCCPLHGHPHGAVSQRHYCTYQKLTVGKQLTVYATFDCPKINRAPDSENKQVWIDLMLDNTSCKDPFFKFNLLWTE